MGCVSLTKSERQTQDPALLSRDVEHASQTLSPISDKEKEQNRLQQAQLIGQISNQVSDIARTKGSIRATQAASKARENASNQDLRAAKAVWEKAHPGQMASSNDILRQVYDTTYNDTLKASGFGTGGQYQQAIQAATAAVQGLAGGDVKAALAGGAAPYIAEVIGHHSELSPAGKVAAHAVVNAALAADQGQNAMAGAAGASTAEIVGMIAGEMYGKPVNELDDTQKQTVSALATLAAGLAGGLADDSGAAAVSGAQAGKTTVENNSLSFGNGIDSTIAMNAVWNQYAVDNNLTPEETQAGLNRIAKGDMPEGANITKAIVEGYQDGVFMAGAIYLGPTVAVGKGITGAVIGGGANSLFQYMSMSPDSEFSYYSAAVAAGAGYLAPGYNIKGNTLINMGGAFMTDGPSLTGQGGAIAGSLAGGYFGKYAPELIAPYVGSFSGVIGDIGSASVFEISNDTVKELIKNKDKKQ